MKILKKFLLVCLFSCIFLIGNAKAYTENDFQSIQTIVNGNNYSINFRYWGENNSSNRINITYCKDNALLTTDYIFVGDNGFGGTYNCSNGVNYMRRLNLNNSAFTNWTPNELLNNNFDFKNSSYSWGPELSTSKGYGTTALFNVPKNRLYILEDLDKAGVIYSPNDIYYSDATNVILSKDVFGSAYLEPTYSYEVESTENGKYKVNFKFKNYDNEKTNYRFSLVNTFSKASYGDENSYKNYCFYDIEDLYNTIPFGNEYSIEVDNSTILELKLYQYNKIESCYEEIEVKNEFIDVNMINNSMFETKPNFIVDSILYNNINGHFENLGSLGGVSDTCYYTYSNDLDNKNVFDCNKKVQIPFEFNGYVNVFLSRNNMTLYNRKINVSGASDDKPKILYDIENYVGYSNVVWHINNQDYSDDISYRYSLNDGLSYSDWTLLSSNTFVGTIKVTQSNNVILEIKDNKTNEKLDSVIIPINIGYSSTLIDNVNMDNYQNLIGYLPPGPLDTILNLPLTFLKSLLKSLGGVCNPVKVTLPFVNTELKLPCQNNFYENVGATSFFNSVGIIASTIMLYSYFVYLYRWIDKLLHLERTELVRWGA